MANNYMVIGVFGLPGMGKTSFLTKCAQLCLRGKSFMGLPVHSKVFTNFECQGCYKLDFDKLGIYHYEDALILIDEIMLLADNRDFKTFPANLKYFFSHFRHFSCTVVYCSQFWRDADIKIRNVTDRYYLITRSNFLPVTIIKPIIRDFTVNRGCIDDGYYLGAPITWRFVWRPRWYKYFDSYTQRELKPLTDLELWEFDVEKENVDLIADDVEKESPLPIYSQSVNTSGSAGSPCPVVLPGYSIPSVPTPTNDTKNQNECVDLRPSEKDRAALK